MMECRHRWRSIAVRDGVARCRDCGREWRGRELPELVWSKTHERIDELVTNLMEPLLDDGSRTAAEVRNDETDNDDSRGDERRCADVLKRIGL